MAIELPMEMKPEAWSYQRNVSSARSSQEELWEAQVRVERRYDMEDGIRVPKSWEMRQSVRS